MAHLSTMTPKALDEWVTERYIKVWDERYKWRIYTELCEVTNSNRAFEEYWEVSGLGTFALKVEGNAIQYDDPVEGLRKRVTFSVYGLGYRVTEEMRDDDRWDVVTAAADDLANSGMDHQERLAHEPWNEAFVNTNFSALDGVAMISTSHTSLKGGGTRSNRLNPDADLSDSSMEAMLTMMQLTVDDQGRYIPFRPNLAVFHPNEQWEFARITDSQYRPGTADNDINTMSSSRTGLKGINNGQGDPYLTDTDAWFLMDTRHKPVKWFDRKKLTPDTGTDFDTKDWKKTMHYRAGVATITWEGVAGTSGS